MKRVFSLIVLCALILSFSSCSIAGKPFYEDSNAISNATRSVLLLTCYDQKGEAISTGSGFIMFEDGIIVTNYHVIEGNISAIKANTENGMYFDIDEILCYDVEDDIAILKTKAKTNLIILQPATSSSLSKGSRIVTIGSPLGLMNAVSEGIYSGTVVDETDYILFTAPISSGSSGGALFNEKGEVIGVTSAMYTEGQNLNLAVPIEKVVKLWGDYQSGNYVDVKAQEIPGIENPADEEKGKPKGKFEIGKYVLLGHYEQNNILNDGKEKIQWRILDIQDGKALVVSRYILDYQRFNTDREETTWEKCSLRKWLNNNFYKTAFDSDEQKYILESIVSADINQEFKTSSGNSVSDKLFLLSIEEASSFLDQSSLATNGTEYAYSQGLPKHSYAYKDHSNWWLRTNGAKSDTAADVETEHISKYGNTVELRNGIRPAMWIAIP